MVHVGGGVPHIERDRAEVAMHRDLPALSGAVQELNKQLARAVGE